MTKSSKHHSVGASVIIRLIAAFVFAAACQLPCARNAAAAPPPGPPTEAEVKATIEKTFTTDYESHFFGVKNKVTFEWVGGVVVGQPQGRQRFPAISCYPVKLNVKVTATDPRDGKSLTVPRGTEAKIGGYSKKEIFCFYRNGFGEWEFDVT
jgi:hypothetical protein